MGGQFGGGFGAGFSQGVEDELKRKADKKTEQEKRDHEKEVRKEIAATEEEQRQARATEAAAVAAEKVRTDAIKTDTATDTAAGVAVKKAETAAGVVEQAKRDAADAETKAKDEDRARGHAYYKARNSGMWDDYAVPEGQNPTPNQQEALDLRAEIEAGYNPEMTFTQVSDHIFAAKERIAAMEERQDLQEIAQSAEYFAGADEDGNPRSDPQQLAVLDALAQAGDTVGVAKWIQEKFASDKRAERHSSWVMATAQLVQEDKESWNTGVTLPPADAEKYGNPDNPDEFKEWRVQVQSAYGAQMKEEKSLMGAQGENYDPAQGRARLRAVLAEVPPSTMRAAAAQAAKAAQADADKAADAARLATGDETIAKILADHNLTPEERKARIQELRTEFGTPPPTNTGPPTLADLHAKAQAQVDAGDTVGARATLAEIQAMTQKKEGK
jgi:hypothetical protein